MEKRIKERGNKFMSKEEKDGTKDKNIWDHMKNAEKTILELKESFKYIDIFKNKFDALEDKVAMNTILGNAKAIIVPEGKGIFWTNKIEELTDKLQKCGVRGDFRLDEQMGFITELKEQVKLNVEDSDENEKVLTIHEEVLRDSIDFSNLLLELFYEKDIINKEDHGRIYEEIKNMKKKLKDGSKEHSIHDDPIIKKAQEKFQEILESSGENSVPNRETVYLEKPRMDVKENPDDSLQNSKPETLASSIQQTELDDMANIEKIIEIYDNGHENIFYPDTHIVVAREKLEKLRLLIANWNYYSNPLTRLKNIGLEKYLSNSKEETK